LRHGSLFSGIGGFDLAAEWMGWDNVFHCEWNPFGQKVLKHYWPKSISYDDITKTDFTIHRGTIDVLSGGFPCQPYSLAGKRKGKEDDRHLWPEMLRAIREIAPTFVVGENVYGLVNWNGGMVFDEVQSDLEAEGYEVAPVILPACGQNAPHRRERIWFVAYSNSKRREGGEEQFKTKKRSTPNEKQFKGRNRLYAEQWENFPTQPPICQRNDGLPYRLVRYLTNELKYEISNTSEKNRIENLHEVWERISQEAFWEKIRRFYSLESKDILFQTMQLYTGGNFGQIELSPFSEDFSKSIMQHLRKYKEFRRSPQGQELEKQRSEQFGNTLSFLPHEVALAARRFEVAIAKFKNWHRNESIKGYGNAVVPQIPYQIFKAIEQFLN